MASIQICRLLIWPLRHYHDRGIGSELISYLTSLAKRQGLKGFTGDALAKNQPIFALIRRMGFDAKMENESGVFRINLMFKDNL